MQGKDVNSRSSEKSCGYRSKKRGEVSRGLMERKLIILKYVHRI